MSGVAARNVAGIVLAGGASNRMRRDKARLRLGGQSLIERTLGVLGALFDDMLVVADREERFAGIGNARVVRDIVPGIGPLGGIYTGLTETDKDAGFVVACDMPLLDPGVMARQIDLWCAAAAEAVVPLLDGRPEPLHSIYAKRCLPAIRKQIDRGDYHVRALFSTVRVCFWRPEPADARAFTNVNTPGQWARLLETEDTLEC